MTPCFARLSSLLPDDNQRFVAEVGAMELSGLRVFLFPHALMAFLTLPSSTVLVQRIVWLHCFKAGWADEDPLLRFIDANTVKNIVCLLAPLTGLGSNAFDWHNSVVRS